MTKKTHSIKLRGPWTVSLRDSNGDAISELRINIRTPDDWWSWLNGADPQELAVARCIVYTRQFNWLDPRPVPTNVELVVDGTVDAIELNDLSLLFDHSSRDNECRISVLPDLRPGNVVKLKYSLASLTEGSSLEELSGNRAAVAVCLQITE